MTLAAHIPVAPQWTAFELNVLRRLNFKSAVLPLAGNSVRLAARLKRDGIRVSLNDPAQWAYTRAVADVENNREPLSADDLTAVLENAYVPGYELQNPGLKNRFGETDAWWFDNVRRNIERLASPRQRAVALSLGMQTGDYALSFTEETRELRQPPSKVYERLFSVYPAPFDNGQDNGCANKPVNEFVAESFADLMFLRLPPGPRDATAANAAWREEWIRMRGDFWPEMQTQNANRFGAPVETKSQFLNLLETTLAIASHIQTWAIAYAEDGFVTTQDIAAAVARIRPVETVYSKDFSEFAGLKAGIITA